MAGAGLPEACRMKSSEWQKWRQRRSETLSFHACPCWKLRDQILIEDPQLRGINSQPASRMDVRGGRLQVISRVEQACERRCIGRNDRVRAGQACKEFSAQFATACARRQTGKWIFA